MFAQETGGHENWRPQAEWRQALVYVREMDRSDVRRLQRRVQPQRMAGQQ